MTIRNQRLRQLVRGIEARVPQRCYIGMWVSKDGHVGVVDAQFIDLQAALDCGLIDDTWYADQVPTPKGRPEDGWVSVVTEDGCVLMCVSELEQ